MIRQYELIERIKAYNPDFDEDLVNKAYVYAMKKHGAQTRASGDLYFSHPLEVAAILTDMSLDIGSVITALLHDTVEDTDATLEEIEALFGTDIRKLVDGVTKLTKIELQNPESKQAENFRKLVLAMSEDIRVLLVKLADRLHNMRTLHHIEKESKRRRIALETLEIYVPLAERVGVHAFKEELEDIAFSILNPEARDSILKRLNFLKTEDTELVEKVIACLEKDLSDTKLDIKIAGREKTPYSVWRKMQRKNISFEQLSDIMAFRCIVDSVADCYHVLGVIHGKYPTVPGRFKDYISLPKTNGYRSLHTTVIGPESQRIEIQIRTHGMHQESELGVAAHWAYKSGEQTQTRNQKLEGKQYRWLRELMDIVENAPRAEEFLENTKLELYSHRVFCFTPGGDLIELASGSTPVDFAYAVHSQVGDRCTGAKINGRIVPLNTKLKNGDQVDIITNKNSTPSPNWERFVITGKARARIRRFVRLQQREQYEALGKAMLQKTYKQEDYPFNEKPLNKLLKRFKTEELPDLYAGIGSGHIQARDVFKAANPEFKSKPADPKIKKTPQPQKKKGKSQPMPIKGLIPGMALHYARCCHPLPGDKIVGIVTTGKGVTIHTVDCDTLENFADTPERWLDISWDENVETSEAHTARLKIIVMNEPGALGTISTIIGQAEGNITNLKIANRKLDYYEMHLDIFVRDTKHLSEIMRILQSAKEISSVQRPKGR